jgi:CubicO group peptidase (beta-lactamase class C family)
VKNKSSKVLLCLAGVLCISLLSLIEPHSVAAQDDALGAKIDHIFAAWDRSDSPGCAVAVMRGGKIIYKRGYGMADLEHDVRISPSTVFYVGSVSKQFTAMAVALLVKEEKVGLDDNVRKYIPELPDYGAPITIRHLVHHTSGLRDYNTLLSLAGRRGDEAFDNQVVLEIASRQKELNFKPGDQYLYSNTGYAMLAVIVERASGMRLSEYAVANIFKPLGLVETHFHDDLSRIVKNRAYAYAPKRGGGWQLDTPYNERSGAGGLFTTVEELLKWDQNFYDGTVGGMELIRQLETPSTLNSGKQLEYGFGLRVAKYKGLRVVEHGGALAGYRAQVTRFPDQRFSVACLCNLGTINPGRLAQQIADLYLAGQQAKGEGAGASAFVDVPEQELKNKVGAYRDPLTGEVWRFSVRDGKLATSSPGPPVQFGAVSPTRFRSASGPLQVELEFHRRNGDGRWLVRIEVEGESSRDLEPVDLVTPGPAELTEYAGSYYSEELQATYVLVLEGDKLVFKQRGAPQTGLVPTVKDSFAVGALTVNFTRDARGGITGFKLNAGRVRNLQFVRRDPPGKAPITK